MHKYTDWDTLIGESLSTLNEEVWQEVTFYIERFWNSDNVSVFRAVLFRHSGELVTLLFFCFSVPPLI